MKRLYAHIATHVLGDILMRLTAGDSIPHYLSIHPFSLTPLPAVWGWGRGCPSRQFITVTPGNDSLLFSTVFPQDTKSFQRYKMIGKKKQNPTLYRAKQVTEQQNKWRQIISANKYCPVLLLEEIKYILFCIHLALTLGLKDTLQDCWHECIINGQAWLQYF